MDKLEEILAKINMTAKEICLIDEINKEAEIYTYHKKSANASIKKINDNVERLRNELVKRYKKENQI